MMPPGPSEQLVRQLEATEKAFAQLYAFVVSELDFDPSSPEGYVSDDVASAARLAVQRHFPELLEREYSTGRQIETLFVVGDQL